MIKRKAILIDIDGTLAEVEHRIVNGKCDHTKMRFDKVNPAVREIIERFSSSHEIIIFTARSNFLRDPTINWLHESDIDYDELFMRPDDEFRKDYICKYEMYKNFVEWRYDVTFAIDDNNKVVDMFRDIDIPCLQIRRTEY